MTEHNSNHFLKIGVSPTCAACFDCSKVGELDMLAAFPAAGETLLLDAAHPIAWLTGSPSKCRFSVQLVCETFCLGGP
jgi:hypothetical protein